MINFNSGKYTQLEIFSKAQSDGPAFLTLNPSNQMQTAGTSRHKRLIFTLEPNTSYSLELTNASMDWAYLCGNEDIFETGVQYLEPDGSAHTQAPGASCSPIREQYHFTPYKNWLNDPNGLCYYKGYYHLFYQQNPFDQKWDTMYWGHACSRDLIHWKHLPIALEPQPELLTAGLFQGGAYSGCALPLTDKVLFYLTRHIEPANDSVPAYEYQVMLESADMLHFSPETVVLGQRPSRKASYDFRDPKVTLIDGVYYMVVASRLGRSAAILLYQSEDLICWNYLGPLLKEKKEDLRCFECPDFFKLDESYAAIGALMCHTDSHGRKQPVRWYTGNFKDNRLKVKNKGIADFGGDFYAAQSFEHEGRRILFGWISDFYGAHQPEPMGAYGSMTLPRQLHIQKGKLYFRPAQEVYTLLKDTLYEGSGEDVTLKNIEGNCYTAKIILNDKTDFVLTLGKTAETRVQLVCQSGECRYRLKGLPSQSVSFTAPIKYPKQIELFVDRRCIEVYLNDGEAVGTKLFYSDNTCGLLKAKFENPGAVAHLKVSTMESIEK